MSLHSKKILYSSLDYFNLFYIIHKWIGIWGVFTLNHTTNEALECETFVKNMPGKNQDDYVTGNNIRRIHVLCNHFLNN
jgi:hypothetical protein